MSSHAAGGGYRPTSADEGFPFLGDSSNAPTSEFSTAPPLLVAVPSTSHGPGSVSQADGHCPLDAGPVVASRFSSAQSMVTGMFMPLAPIVVVAPLVISVQNSLCYDCSRTFAARAFPRSKARLIRLHCSQFVQPCQADEKGPVNACANRRATAVAPGLAA